MTSFHLLFQTEMINTLIEKGRTLHQQYNKGALPFLIQIGLSLETVGAENQQVKVFLEEYDGWVDFFVDVILSKAKLLLEGKLLEDPKKKRISTTANFFDKEEDDELFERLIEDEDDKEDDDIIRCVSIFPVC